ncbi:MAG: (E)-4-hydroxy-3-methylbut-2-enyl-diphosphate synthase [Bacteroidales bacterium]|nr:(E)-4-hydroxy-3-methylbut-2-enyl-diphosphate synthase [Bacteroidales bacterium]
MKNKYFKYSKRRTNEIKIGSLFLGGDNPVRIQSMTNTDTSDTEATAAQIITIVDAGADLVRITVPTSVVAQKIKNIKELLKKKGYSVPLVADIHFSPKAAEISAKYLEKVRINPGNYADLKQFKHIEYTDEEYQNEVSKIKEKFAPLLNTCKEHNTAVRIGTNHGSLSDRILSRYGDTPQGMVESTMEFLRICKKEAFNDVVISMKASNPIVMIHAVRLLVDTMSNEDMFFPIHSGVTEAGNDKEGRIKSAIGIGTLLSDGMGDTIRVSLTEAPEKEIPVAKNIVKVFNQKKLSRYKPEFIPNKAHIQNLYRYSKRKTLQIENIGGDNVPVVISDINNKSTETAILQSGYAIDPGSGNYKKTELAADYLYSGSSENISKFFGDIKFISDKNHYNDIIFSMNNGAVSNKKIVFYQIDVKKFKQHKYKLTANNENSVYVIDISNVSSPVHAARSFFYYLQEKNINTPVVIKYKIPDYNEYTLLECSAIIGALFIDGFGDGIWIESKDSKIKEINELSFGILQACRTRITKTDYISCPSCGRTLFDLEEITAKIKEKTAHLKGIKIGIMGCIVNGPGEMADADFGYVGTGTGKVTLYKKQEVIKRSIPEKDAVEELLKLIEQYY